MAEVLQSEGEVEGWYCLRTRPKSEHLAAHQLRAYANLDEVFCPRIRYEKATRRGKVWFVEALFPGYVFAKFDLAEQLRTVQATPAVTGVLRFADRYPVIADAVLGDFMAEFPESGDAVKTIDPALSVGDEVLIVSGPMKGFTSLVTRVLPGSERVRILMDLLGEEREAEVLKASIARTASAQEGVVGKSK